MEGKFFGEVMGDCRFIAFEDLRSACDELYECLNFDLEMRNLYISRLLRKPQSMEAEPLKMR